MFTHQLENGAKLELSEQDLKNLRRLCDEKFPILPAESVPAASMYEKACRNLESIADLRSGAVFDEDSIKTALTKVFSYGHPSEIADAVYEAAEAAASYMIMATK